MLIIIKIINFIESKIEFSKFCTYGTMIFNILDNTTELYMTKFIIGEFFSSGGATLYKNPSDQTVNLAILWKCFSFYLKDLVLVSDFLVLDKEAVTVRRQIRHDVVLVDVVAAEFVVVRIGGL